MTVFHLRYILSGTAVPADMNIPPCFDGARCDDEVAFRTIRGYILYSVVQPSEKTMMRGSLAEQQSELLKYLNQVAASPIPIPSGSTRVGSGRWDHGPRGLTTYPVLIF